MTLHRLCESAGGISLRTPIGAGWVAAALLLGSCGSVPPRPLRPSLLAEVSATPGLRSPAVWRYHPVAAAPLRAAFDLGGERLLVGDRGERWLVGKSARAAAQLAPEPLVSVQRGTNKEFLFIGQTGSSYLAAEPLGAFLSSSEPPQPLEKVVASGSAIVGISARGLLLGSSDSGVSWRPVSSGEGWFLDVELLENGEGLALSVPEQLWHSRTRGGPWEPLAIGPVGAQSLARQGAEVTVSTVLGAKTWSPTRAQELVPSNSAFGTASEGLSLGKPPPRGPSAAALVEGRAVVVGDTYFELAPADKKRALSGAPAREAATGREVVRWTLWRGPFAGRLQSVRLEDLSGCYGAKLAVFGDQVEVACARDPLSETTQKLAFFRGTLGSAASPLHLSKESFVARGRLFEVDMVLSARGALAVAGICGDGPVRGCKARGIYFRRLEEPKSSKNSSHPKVADAPAKNGPAPPKFELAAARAPSLRGFVDGLAASPDGLRLYAVGATTKRGTYSLFFSRDGGQSYQSRDLSPVVAAYATSSDTSSDYDDRERSSSGTYGSSKVESISVGEDGTVALVFRQYGKAQLLVTDEEGRLVSVARPPEAVRLLSAVGTRALAVAASSGEAWESLDAGSSWSPLGRAAIPLCTRDPDCSIPFSCQLVGCVLGDELSRVGWNGQAEVGADLLAPSVTPKSEGFEPRLREPLSCVLEERPWVKLEGTHQIPTAEESSIGEVAWFMEAENPKQASTWVWHGRGGKRPGIDKQILLAPVPRPEGYAVHSAMQIEGVAALRFPIGGGELKNLEVVWENLFEKRVVHARLPHAGTLLSVDTAVGDGGASEALPGMLSIAERGIYVRPHGLSRDTQTTYFLDGKTTKEIPPVTWPTETAFTEMAHLADSHRPFAVSADRSEVIFAREQGPGFDLEAHTVGIPEATAKHLVQTSDLVYSGPQIGLAIGYGDPMASFWHSAFYSFSPQGSVLVAPETMATPLDLPRRPRACTPQERQQTPRWVAPFMAGTRHPIWINEASEPPRLMLSGSSVVQGTVREPCLSAIDAQRLENPDHPESVQESAVIPWNDLEHSWIFRVATSEDGQSPAEVEVHAMNCRFDPAVEIPASVYEAPGTKVRR